MPDIFISYAREDIEIAKRLSRDLKAEGFDVWLDNEKLLPGQHFESVIQSAIRESRFAIVLLSERSRSKRGYVQKEQHYIFDVLDEYPDSTVYLLPVRLGHCDLSQHVTLRKLQWVDLYPDYDKGLISIISSIRLHGGVRQASYVRTSSKSPSQSCLPKENSQPTVYRRLLVVAFLSLVSLALTVSAGYYVHLMSATKKATPTKLETPLPALPPSHTSLISEHRSASAVNPKSSFASNSKGFPRSNDDGPYLVLTEGVPRRLASISATTSVTFHSDFGGYASLNIVVDGKESRVESILGKGGEICVETDSGIRRLSIVGFNPEEHKLTLEIR